MRIKMVIAGCALLVAGLSPVKAQQGDYLSVTGRVIMAPYFTPEHMLLLSQNDYIYGTSRSAAMGGAFASLGADLSSMNINPAGLGMYQSSDWGITQALSIDGMKTSSAHMAPGALSSGGTRVSYGLNNVGIAYNIFNRSGTFTSLTLGFSYNRVVNFNSRSSLNTVGEHASIVEMFHNQLNGMLADGIGPGYLRASANPFENEDIYLDQWGAVLGYRTGLLTYDEGGGTYLPLSGIVPSNTSFGSVTRGGMYEYVFSAGANIGNVIYLGATLGVTQINYREDNSYGEEYPSAGAISGMTYNQRTNIKGTGLTAKFGVIARPMPGLRIGVAFHLPTYYTIAKAYDSEMEAATYLNSGELLTDEIHFNTAPRLLAGISGVIADRAIVALDYEVAWYNAIRERYMFDGNVEGSKAAIRGRFKPAHSMRAGFEMRASDVVSLRAGGGYRFDFMKDKFAITNDPVAKSGYNITAGVGFNVGRNGYIDLTYVYDRAKYADYEFYYYDDGEYTVSQYDEVDDRIYDRTYTQHRNHHMITLTLGSRF